MFFSVWCLHAQTAPFHYECFSVACKMETGKRQFTFTSCTWNKRVPLSLRSLPLERLFRINEPPFSAPLIVEVNLFPFYFTRASCQNWNQNKKHPTALYWDFLTSCLFNWCGSRNVPIVFIFVCLRSMPRCCCLQRFLAFAMVLLPQSLISKIWIDYSDAHQLVSHCAFACFGI